MPKLAIRLVGAAIALPALLLVVWSYYRPAIRTVLQSFQSGSLIERDDREWVGLDNYASAGGAVPGGLVRSLVLAVVPLLIVLIVAPALAYAANRAGRAGRRTVLLALTVPAVCYAPTAIAIAWYASREHTRPATWTDGLGVLSLSTFGLVCAIGVTVYLAVLRSTDSPPRVWLAAAAVAAVLILAILAAMVQVYDTMALTGVRPSADEGLPAMAIFQDAFVRFRTGTAAAMSTLLLVVVAVLGVVATVVVIVTGLGARFDPVRPVRVRPLALVATAIGAAVVLVVAVVGLWPWLSRAGQTSGDPDVTPGLVLANTWLPPLISTVVAIGCAALAGFGIGALRPLGRRSELLLLPFAPFLFVGITPLMTARFDDIRDAGTGDTFLGLIPPTWISVPALVIFTVFFRGQQLHHRPTTVGGSALRVLLPSLPLIAVVGLATWLVAAQDLLWPLIVGNTPDQWTGTVLVYTQQRSNRGPLEGFDLGLVLPPGVIVVLAVVLGLTYLFFLERLTIEAVREPAADGRPAPIEGGVSPVG